MPPREEIFRGGDGGGRAIQLPGASPDAFGAGIGRAISQVGEGISRREDDAAAAALGVSLAQAGADIEAFALEARTNAAAGGDGLVEAVSEYATKRRGEVLQTVTDRRLRQRAEVQLANLQANVEGREAAVAAGLRAGKIVADHRAMRDILANGATDPESWSAALEQHNEAVDMLEGLDGNKKEALHREGEQTITYAFADRLADAQPAALREMIKAGRFSEILTPEQISVLDNRADVTFRREQSQAAAAQAQAVAAEKRAIEAQETAFEVGSASAEELTGLAARARAVGDDAKAIRLEARAVAWSAAQTYRGASPAERDGRIAELRAKPTLAPTEGAELKGLEEQAAYVDRLPAIGRFQYATGQAVPPIDWADPASVQQRATLVDSARETFGGVPEFLSTDETNELRGIVERGGFAEKATVARAIVQTGRHAAAILDKVAAGDATFRAAAKLAAYDDGGERLRSALEGAEAIKADKTLFDRPKDASGQFVGPTFDQTWSWLARGPLRALPPAAQADLRENTRNLYAKRAQLGGFASFRASALPGVVGYGLGGENRGGDVIGGLRQWNGAWVVVPAGMPQSEFDNRLGRAGAVDWARAGNGAPLLSTGQKASADDARRMTPVWVGGSRYRLATGPNSFAVTESGDFYTLDIRRLKNW